MIATAEPCREVVLKGSLWDIAQNGVRTASNLSLDGRVAKWYWKFLTGALPPSGSTGKDDLLNILWSCNLAGALIAIGEKALGLAPQKFGPPINTYMCVCVYIYISYAYVRTHTHT